MVELRPCECAAPRESGAPFYATIVMLYIHRGVPLYRDPEKENRTFRATHCTRVCCAHCDTPSKTVDNGFLAFIWPNFCTGVLSTSEKAYPGVRFAIQAYNVVCCRAKLFEWEVGFLPSARAAERRRRAARRTPPIAQRHMRAHSIAHFARFSAAAGM